MDGEREFGELKATVEGLCQAFQDFRDQTRAWQGEVDKRLMGRLDQHSGRLRALEQWRSWLTGGLALLGILWAAAVVWLKR